MAIMITMMAMALWTIDVDPIKRDLMLSDKRCPVVITRWVPSNGSLWTAENVRRNQSLEATQSAYEVNGPDYAATFFRKDYAKDGAIIQRDFFGDLFFRGCSPAGFQSRKDVAAAWYEAAAIRHYAPAQWKLGRMLMEGDGIDQDLSAGQSWLTLAASEGSLEAADYLARKGLPVPAALQTTTFEIMREESEKAYSEVRKRYWSGIMQDTTRLMANVAAVYVQANAVAVQEQPAIRNKSPTPVPPPYAPPAKVKMVTPPAICYARDAGSFGSGDTLYMSISVFCY